MRESAKRRAARAAARRRRRLAIGGGTAVGALAVVAIVGLAIGSGGHAANACVIADVSESTEIARERYGDEFARFATAIGLDGSGEICVIFAAADPLAESLAEPLFVGPAESKKGGLEEVSDIEAKVATARTDLEARLADPSIREEGSALLEAATDASRFLQPGDRLLFLSDGLQWTPDLHLEKLDLSGTAITTLLDELEAEGLVPDLDGVSIDFPYLLYHPGGLERTQVRRIIEFWEEWAARTGASIDSREPVDG